MSKENKVVKLNDEELEKVSGGGADYVEGVHKEIGFAFYSDSTGMVYKIAEVAEFVGAQNGYDYKIHLYMFGSDTGYVGSLYDYQIDNFVKLYGRPE